MSARFGATLAAQWASYEVILLAEAGEVQRRETRRAFYAGAQALLVVMTSGLSDHAETTESDEALMASVDAELKQFVRDIEEGRA